MTPQKWLLRKSRKKPVFTRLATLKSRFKKRCCLKEGRGCFPNKSSSSNRNRKILLRTTSRKPLNKSTSKSSNSMKAILLLLRTRISPISRMVASTRNSLDSKRPTAWPLFPSFSIQLVLVCFSLSYLVKCWEPCQAYC